MNAFEQPQWSPPAGGGTTSNHASARGKNMLPQWSRRPVAGRRRGSPGRSRRPGSRNGAHPSAADDRSKWRSTREPPCRPGQNGARRPRPDDVGGLRVPVAVVANAATEPADQQRDDRHAGQLGAAGAVATMEPADERGGRQSYRGRQPGDRGCRNGTRRPGASRR